MINSERRRNVAQAKLANLVKSRDSQTDETGRFVYTDLIDELQTQIERYDAIRSGICRTFAVESMDDLGPALVSARLARGITQRELADELGIREQNIQRDEDREYEAAGIAKLAEVLDALGYEFFGTVRPRVTQPSSPPTAGVGSSSTSNVLTANILRPPAPYGIRFIHLSGHMPIDVAGVSNPIDTGPAWIAEELS